MSPDMLISTLDAYLLESGEDIVLRRQGVDVIVRAAVRLKDRPDELVSGSKQDDVLVVISMTQIRAEGWHVGTTGTAPYVRDTAIPRRGDEAIIKGIRYRVEAADPIAVNNVVVRVNMTVKGNTSGA